MFKLLNKKLFLLATPLKNNSLLYTISKQMATSIDKITFLEQQKAQKIDEDLMGKYNFTVDVLMELAGQSVAQSIYHLNSKYHSNQINNILIICGPGNNGGDGIVAARHLKMFGLNPSLFVVKKPKSQFFEKMLCTCTVNEIPIFDYEELSKELESKQITLQENIQKNYQMVVDAIFGFSFKPPIRTPFDSIINSLIKLKDIPIYSVDIPSGWDIEKGNVNNGLEPNYLISLTLPKVGAKEFKGKHFLGGRFVPEQLVKEYGLVIPKYQGMDTFIELN